MNKIDALHTTVEVYFTPLNFNITTQIMHEGKR